MPRRVLAALASGGVLCLAFPTYDIWVAAPVALAGLAWATTGVRVRSGFGLGLLFGLAFFVPTLHWSGIYVGMVPWLALSILEALFVALGAAAYAWLAREGRVRPLAFALVWVVAEGFRARAPYGGFPWVKLAFSQADSPFGRLVSLGGPPFVGFVIALAAGCLALAVTRIGRMPLGSLARPAAVALVLGLAGLAVPMPTDGPTVQVLGVQGNVPRPGLEFNAERRAVLDNHVAATERAAADVAAGRIARPDLVVWPENASDIDPIVNLDAAEVVREAVEAVNTPVIVGGLLDGPGTDISNVSLLYLPGAGLVDRYTKRHPVPFAEYIPDRDFWRHFSDKVDLVTRNFHAGTGPGVFDISTARGVTIRAGIAICFEVAYDDIMRDVVNAGANLLVVQTNNATFGFTAESPQQLAISRVRAMEFGRSVIHVSTVGQSALITPDGTAHQVTSLFTQAVIDGAVPLRGSTTLATRVGEVPEWLAAAALLVLLLTSVRGLPRRAATTIAPDTKDEDDDDAA